MAVEHAIALIFLGLGLLIGARVQRLVDRAFMLPDDQIVHITSINPYHRSRN